MNSDAKRQKCVLGAGCNTSNESSSGIKIRLKHVVPVTKALCPTPTYAHVLVSIALLPRRWPWTLQLGFYTSSYEMFSSTK